MTRRNQPRGWMGWVRLGGAAAVLGLALLAQPEEAAAREACSLYVSGGVSNPAFGTLIGSMTVEECAVVQGGIPGTGATYQRCLTYEVGYYNFGASAVPIDCRNYTVWDR